MSFVNIQVLPWFVSYVDVYSMEQLGRLMLVVISILLLILDSLMVVGGFRYGKKHFVKIVTSLVRVILELTLCSGICFIIRKKPLF